ncbi:MAG: hypothetical protein DSY55_03080 [Clostridia bacterium]|nr:MAG: hypothetical protein DSY55_03080 [Clostridia bacterium]
MYEKIVLVTRKTRLEGLIERFNTRAQAQFYIEHNGGDFTLFQLEHERYYQAVHRLQKGLKALARLHVIERQFLPTFIFARSDLVVTIGIDGLVVNTAKYLSGQPVIAVNPDPEHIDGVLLPFTVGKAIAAARRALAETPHTQAIPLAEARLNDGQRLLAFNDLFIGRSDHKSARYRISFDGRSERHSSSGVIVSTGVGATGWLSSLFNMANGMNSFFGKGCKLTPPTLKRTDDALLFVVREPFISKTSAASLVCGAITPKKPLSLESTMPDGGVIFSDGVLDDYLDFNAGHVAQIGLAAQKVKLVR